MPVSSKKVVVLDCCFTFYSFSRQQVSPESESLPCHYHNQIQKLLSPLAMPWILCGAEQTKEQLQTLGVGKRSCGI